MRRRELDGIREAEGLESLVEVENSRKDVGGVERVFEEDLVADGDVADLISWDVGKYIGPEPVEGGVGGVGGEGGEDFVGHADHEHDSGAREGSESGGIRIKEADIFDAVGF